MPNEDLTKDLLINYEFITRINFEKKLKSTFNDLDIKLNISIIDDLTKCCTFI